MSKIFDYLKVVVLLLGVLVGVQVPGFVDQYGKNLASRVSESGRSVSQFQKDADKFFDGEIDKLVEHYWKTGDLVIASGGDSIESLFLRNRTLIAANNDFKKSVYSSYYHVAIKPVHEILSDTWQRYTYSVVLNPQAIIASIIGAVSFLAFFELVIFLFVLVVRALSKPKVNRRRPRRPEPN